ncbi:MAG: PAS domain S-box protein [Actinomycetes bacterium]
MVASGVEPGLVWIARADPDLVSGARHAEQRDSSRALVVQDAVGSVAAANLAAAQILGLALADLLGMQSPSPLWSAISVRGLPIDADLHPAVRAVETGEPASAELMGVLVSAQDAPGFTRWLDVSAEPIGDPAIGVLLQLVDVSDTPRGNDASQTLLAEYRLASEAVTDGVLRIDRNGLVSWASGVVLRAAGGTLGWVIGQSITTWMHPDDVAAFWQALSADSADLQLECRFRNAQKQYRWILVRIRPIFDVQGHAVGATLGLRDVHDQTLARLELEATARELQDAGAALAESERLYRILADNGTDSVFLVDLEGLFTWVSPATRQVLGYDPAALIGLNGMNWIHPDDVPVLLSIRQRVDSGQVVRQEMRHLTSSGEYRWMVSVTNPARDADGAVVGRMVALRDIHDQVLARQELVASERRFKSMFENHNAVMLLIEPASGRIVDANNAAARFYGYSVEDLCSMVVSQLNVLPPEEVARRRAQAAEGNSSYFVFPHRMANGEVRTVDVYSSPIEDHGRWLLFSIIHDATDRVEYESQLRQAVAMSDSAASGVIVIDPTAVVRQVNPAFTAITGWPRESVVGKNARVLASSVIGSQDLERISAAITDLTDFRGELSILCADGRESEVVGSVTTVLGPDGAVASYVGTLTDISDRVRIQRELSDSELRYQLLAEKGNDVVARIDPGGAFVWVSPALERVLGYSPADLVGVQAVELTHPDDLAMMRSRSAELDRGATEVRFEVRLRTSTGMYRWMSGVLGPVSGTETASGTLFVALRDIQEQVQAREELAERRARLAELQGELSTEKDRLELVLRSARLATWDWNMATGQTVFDERWAEIVGYRLEELEPVSIDTWVRLTHPDDLTRSSEAVVRHSEGLDPFYDVEVRMRHQDGDWVWVHDSGKIVERDTQGRPLRMTGTHEDITDRVHAREALIESEQRYRLLAENASDVVWQVSSNGTVMWASESTPTVLGWSRDELQGRTALEFVHPDDLKRAKVARARVLAGGTAKGEYRFRCADGTFRSMAVDARLIDSKDTNSEVVTLRDIQDEVTAREELIHAIEHDALTGLANRALAVLRIERLLSDLPVRGPRNSAGVLCIGVDSLMAANEALTYAGGDQILETIATRIALNLDDIDLMARGSGDEFLVMLPSLLSGADAGVFAERLRLACKGPIQVGMNVVEPTVSVGIATGGADANADDLLRDAALAMRQAKDGGRDRCEFFQEQLAIEAQQRLSVEAGIREGLLVGEFVPWFQPVVTLTDGAVVGYEALVRWVRPDGSVVPPIDFLPVAERSNLIAELDRAVLMQSVSVLARLPDPLHIAVNVSASTLTGMGYAELVVEALAEFGADPSRLILEVTETALLVVTKPIRDAMGRLADFGIRWYADDFGTGYSSIANLRDLPIAGLKLDMSFTAGIRKGDRTSERLGQALSGLADGLGLDTVAEGIETAEEAAVLIAQGWKHGQGWLYGRPAPLSL